jgi:hypothetical protein
MRRARSARLMSRAKGADKTRRRSEERVQEEMAQELFMIVKRALAGFGLSTAGQRRALARALRARKTPNASGRVRRHSHRLGDLTAVWFNDPRYLGPDGRPRALPIRGAVDSFESLARRFLPGLPLEAALKLALRHSEVILRPGEKIALTGSPNINTARSANWTLATAIRQVDYLLQAMQEGYRRCGEPGFTTGLDRMLATIVPREAYEQTVKRLRPQINDLLEQTDAALLNRNQPWKAQEACALIMGTYVVREDDFDRLGVKPAETDSRISA